MVGQELGPIWCCTVPGLTIEGLLLMRLLNTSLDKGWLAASLLLLRNVIGQWEEQALQGSQRILPGGPGGRLLGSWWRGGCRQVRIQRGGQHNL